MVSHILILSFLIQTIPTSGAQWDFAQDPVGKLPRGWQTRGDNSGSVYKIKAEPDGNRYLSAESSGSDVQLGVEFKSRPAEFPILTWRWRVWELPKGADERKSKTLDSAAGVYVVFGSSLFPRILKYVWSTSAPEGQSFKHPSSGRMAIIVVNSGAGATGQWLGVRRNLVADYTAAFGDPPPDLIGIGVKTDSDSTRTSSRADYDDIQLTRR